ncbi:hypothetical protein AB0G00_24030 [Nocardia salmonicida]|uniref:hypothetical protein n=1 Tax=Nocardia salmonicida TaxID=53431 RepID=UPI0033FA019E
MAHTDEPFDKGGYFAMDGKVISPDDWETLADAEINRWADALALMAKWPDP